ncbi:hypothetical protein RFEPED_0071 [Rickettsia felis str. Pedreira]|uniref:Uncharacterized protein n=2 Tax=Rickettsia felis TaxID=42862 RepID=A0A0F3MPN8_RICFI|nr:hypothetical protein [Rickettsia felis]AAY61566.1 unknown [Rickettsia felis URRWXCal2]KHO02958.1 hypothetical protein JS55_04125 [Rickettsia felis str. LSU]KHO03618.1 hypothetical protein JS61_04000 [Rickettsia felis]KJV57705.1 hypothetical protein RFEPED_0071 [Rickettsia felis str. Pedreira]MDE8611808.1 hypothetical protein [Rickettsia felis]
MLKKALNVEFPIDIKQLQIDLATEQMAIGELRAIVSKCTVGIDENGNHIVNDPDQFEKIKKLTSLAFSVGISIHSEPNIIFDSGFNQGVITFSGPADDAHALGDAKADETENV